jgi:hypothetical protein
MSLFRCVLTVVVIVGSCVRSSHAQIALKDPQRLTFDKDGHISPFRSKPARALMSDAEFRRYTQALQLLDCETAGAVLNTAFIRLYPQFQRARLKPRCGSDRDCRYWRHYANVNFKEFGYCIAIVKLRTAEQELRQRNVVAPKFALKPWRQRTEYENYWVEARDRNLAILISQAETNYTPALIRLAALVRRGDIFNADEVAEYYILRRACILGHDCTTLAHRLAYLRRLIAPKRLIVIERKVHAKRKRKPVLHTLLRGGKL